MASVKQGRELRDRAERLGMDVNEGDRLVVGGYGYIMDGGLTLHVVGPLQAQIDEFQEAWDRELRRRGWDRSPDAPRSRATPTSRRTTWPAWSPWQNTRATGSS